MVYDVPTYRVRVHSVITGESSEFVVTRDAMRDISGQGNVEDKTFRGEGWFRGAIREDGSLGARIEVRDFYDSTSAAVREKDGTIRRNIQLHIGPGCSGGCPLMQGGRSVSDANVNRIKQMLDMEQEAGYGRDIFIRFDSLPEDD